SLKQWQDNVGHFCEGNSRLTLVVSTAFAAPLLSLIGEENGGIHIHGNSSEGKTTALRIACSIYGAPSIMCSWRATSNGLEGVAALYNDALLCLDEISQVLPHAAGEIAYMIANGRGKSRAKRNGDTKPTKRWNVLFLSSGEMSLADHMEDAGKKTRAGQETRLVNIPADTGAHGIFDTLHDYDDGAQLADALTSSCAQYYGTPIRVFLQKLVDAPLDKLQKNFKQFCKDFMEEHVPKDSSGQVKRVGRRFSLIAAAGELATSLRITGWKEGDATKAAVICYNDWIKYRGGTGQQEEKVVLSQIKHFFEQHGESRFTPLNTDSQYPSKTINRAGYRKMNEDGQEDFYVLPESFKTDICHGLDHKFVANVLLKHGLLIPDSTGRTTRAERAPWAKKSTTRVYCISARILENYINEM
ncbi:MAG: DUF927 domain-containing protein, partial [Candidatus Altiarchaeota archaeon]|nr:DUF927 domain-containing protein [Candidatus Altiarchaeota archaeon]